MEDNFEGFIIIIDIIFTIVGMVLGTFQGFLVNYRNSGAATSATIITLKVVVLVVSVVRLIMGMVTTEYWNDREYKYIPDIIWKEVLQGDLFVRVFAIIMLILALALPYD